MIREETVFVVDDDPGVLKALTRLLRSSGYAVAPFSSPLAFLDRHDPAVSGCLVLDVAMPGLNGLELQQRLAQKGNCCAIVFISGHGDVPKSVQAMKAGAVDFLTKPFSDVELLEAVDIAIGKSRAARQVDHERKLMQQRFTSLTSREREVFEHVISGQLNKLIATDLGTVEKTVKVHRARVMHKMGAATFADLVRMAERMGIRPARPSPHL
ncbi:MAG TPA: response regulator [Burkholderiales bacterium]|nr:response regulator [Burkholderiales bacterium]